MAILSSKASVKSISVLGAFGLSIGGDEFVVILEGEDYVNRAALLESILCMSRECNAHQGIVISVGMATCDPAEDKAFARVFRRADQLMYERKLEFKKTQAGKPLIIK